MIHWTAERARSGKGAARRRSVPELTILTVGEAPDYAFPHSAEDESRRLQLLEQRLDPLTKRRIQRLGVSQAALALPKVRVGALSLAEATALIDRPGDDDFLACGFVHIGVWGQRSIQNDSDRASRTRARRKAVE